MRGPKQVQAGTKEIFFDHVGSSPTMQRCREQTQ
jgi:hypothetical protein